MEVLFKSIVSPSKTYRKLVNEPESSLRKADTPQTATNYKVATIFGTDLNCLHIDGIPFYRSVVKDQCEHRYYPLTKNPKFSFTYEAHFYINSKDISRYMEEYQKLIPGTIKSVKDNPERTVTTRKI